MFACNNTSLHVCAISQLLSNPSRPFVLSPLTISSLPLGLDHHANQATHDALPDNCGVATMDELSYYIADPVSKRTSGAGK